MSRSEPALGGAVPLILRQYQRSWVDALIARIGRLPGPAPAKYAVFTMIGSAIGLSVLVATRSLPDTGPYVLQVPVTVALAVGSLALIHYLNAVASERLDQFAPVLALEPPALERVRYELINMPARRAIAAQILGVLMIGLSYQADAAAAEFGKLPVLAQVVGTIADLAGLAMAAPARSSSATSWPGCRPGRGAPARWAGSSLSWSCRSCCG